MAPRKTAPKEPAPKKAPAVVTSKKSATSATNSAFSSTIVSSRDSAGVRSEVLKRMSTFKEAAHTVVRNDATETIAPTRSLVLNDILRLEGIPFGGRMTQWHGEEHSGKSTMSYCCAADYQQFTGMPVAILDFERSVMPKYLASCGLNMRDQGFTFLRRPDSAESALPLVMNLLEAGVRYFVFDSVAKIKSMVKADDLKKGKGLDNQPGKHAKVFAEFLDALAPHMARYDAAQIFINQTRARIEMTMAAQRAMKYASVTNLPYVLSGGKAARFTPSLMIETEKAKAFEGTKDNSKEDTTWLFEGINAQQLGQSWDIFKTNLRVLKNKVNGGGYRKFHIWLRPDTGVDDNITVRELAKHYDLILPGGGKGKWQVGRPEAPLYTYNSKAEAIEDLVLFQNPDILTPLRELVRECIHADQAGYKYERSRRDDFLAGDLDQDPDEVNRNIDLEDDEAEFGDEDNVTPVSSYVEEEL